MYALFFFFLIFVLLLKEGEISAIHCQKATRIDCSLKAGMLGVAGAHQAVVRPTTLSQRAGQAGVQPGAAPTLGIGHLCGDMAGPRPSWKYKPVSQGQDQIW